MTRDEAITKAVPALVDALVALGLLKLDEPKQPWQKAEDALFKRSAPHGGMLTPRWALDALRDAGLKIVEADK